jgi:GGDEF domain-containing protein
MSRLDKLSQLVFNIYEAFTVAFFMREQEQLRCLSAVTFATSFDRNKTIPVEGTLPGWVLKHNEPLIIPNFDKDMQTLGYYGADEDIKSFMGYPMEAEGVIVVDSKKKWVFTDKEKKIFGSLVSLIHDEIERDRRFQDLEDKLEELHHERRILELFNQLSASKVKVNDFITEAIGFSGGDCCFVGMEKSGKIAIRDLFGINNAEYIDKECSGASVAALVMDGERELLLPHNSGMLREKPLFFTEESIKARQLFGFPLTTSGMTIGLIGFISQSDRHLKANSIGLLRTIATLLSLYYSSLWTREHLERLKDFEPVTGSIHFTTFLGITERLMNRGDPFSFLSVRLAHLDSYNRRMGYESADRLLQKVYHVILYCTGSRAFVARKSGGHFYALVRGKEAAEIKNVLKVLHHTIARSISEETASEQKGVVDIGVASFPDDGTNLWDLFERVSSKR